MTAIQMLIKDIKNLKPVPAIANQIVEMVDDPSVAMHDIAKIIEYDPAVTASLIRTCNSAFFGLANPVESVKDAVSILGIDQVVELTLLNASAKTLNRSWKGYGLNEGALWRHAVSSALIAKDIAAKIAPESRNTIFTAALLKDIGKTVLDKFIQISSEKIQTLIDNDGYSFVEAEKKVIGADHAEIGAMLAKMWKFSPKMVKIIRNHHIPDETIGYDTDIAIVYLSDCICMMMGVGVGLDGLSYRFNDKIIRELAISPNDIANIIADFTFNMQKVEALLGVVKDAK
ncbi:MAG: HDOD domain-containing protein [Desulfamplus sp.]|nr:HDOD domain-containing protein [Desulfamplus sp.]